MKRRILYVVHRYAPYPGGSENNVKGMAEETYSRGHEVWVLASQHKGDYNNIRVTDEVGILNQKWDLIIVHGGDIDMQNLVLTNANYIKSPVLYLLIKPSATPVCIEGLNKCAYIGCSTIADWNHVKIFNAIHKSIEVRVTVDEKNSIGHPGFKSKYGINTSKMFISCGGYWQNKAMPEIANIFNTLALPDTTLVLTGYDNRFNLKPQNTEFVKSFLIDSREDVISGIMESDLYIMHSYDEGFGIVLIEAMLNRTPWTGRNIAGATTMSEYGFAYNTNEELIQYVKNFNPDSNKIRTAYDYALNHRLTKHAVDDILAVIK